MRTTKWRGRYTTTGRVGLSGQSRIFRSPITWPVAASPPRKWRCARAARPRPLSSPEGRRVGRPGHGGSRRPIRLHAAAGDVAQRRPRSLRPFMLSQISGWMPWDHLADGVRNGARSAKAFAQRRIDVPATLEPLPSSGRRNSSTQRRSEFHRGNFGQGIGQGHEVQALEMVENVVSDRREMTWPCLLQPC